MASEAPGQHVNMMICPARPRRTGYLPPGAVTTAALPAATIVSLPCLIRSVAGWKPGQVPSESDPTAVDAHLGCVEGPARAGRVIRGHRGDLVRIGDRRGQWIERAGVRDALVRPVPVVEILELAQGVISEQVLNWSGLPVDWTSTTRARQSRHTNSTSSTSADETRLGGNPPRIPTRCITCTDMIFGTHSSFGLEAFVSSSESRDAATVDLDSPGNPRTHG